MPSVWDAAGIASPHTPAVGPSDAVKKRFNTLAGPLVAATKSGEFIPVPPQSPVQAHNHTSAPAGTVTSAPSVVPATAAAAAAVAPPASPKATAPSAAVASTTTVSTSAVPSVALVGSHHTTPFAPDPAIPAFLAAAMVDTDEDVALDAQIAAAAAKAKGASAPKPALAPSVDASARRCVTGRQHLPQSSLRSLQPFITPWL